MKRFLFILVAVGLAVGAWADDRPLVFAKIEHNFGNVFSESERQYADFEFRNTSGKSITITKIVSQSGNIRGSFPKESIAPNGAGKITISWKNAYTLKDIGDGGKFKKFATVFYTDGTKEYRQKVYISACLYFPREQVFNRQIGALSLKNYDKQSVWNYKLCDRKAELSIEYANLTDKNITVVILIHDSVAGMTHTLVDDVMKPGDEKIFSVDMEFDGKKKIETGSLEFIVNNKREAIERISCILWDEVDQATQRAWIEDIGYLYQTQGCY